MNKLILFLPLTAILIINNIGAQNVLPKFGPPSTGDEAFKPPPLEPMEVSDNSFFGCFSPKKSKILFNLYTKADENFLPVHLDDINSLVGLVGSNFDIKKPTKIFIHGWQQTGTPPNNKDHPSYASLQYIVKGYMTAEVDVNLFMIDWGDYSHCIYALATATTVQKVGSIVGTMLTTLLALGVAPSDVHLIGHSLGAHIAHFAVATLPNQIKIARITGLDPAGPNFEGLFPVPRLSMSDAKFVDIIHTDLGGYGISKQIGHVDFYPNGGEKQNGCLSMGTLSACSHERSVAYFADSIKTKIGYYAVKCPNYKDFENGLCNRANSVVMGERTPNNTKGTYYLNTHDAYPFTLGPIS